MIISHKYKFIFIKSKKTAGTSIELDLASRLDPDDVVTPIPLEADGHTIPFEPRNFAVVRDGVTYKLHNHSSIVRAAAAFGEKIAEYFVFTCEREPAEKALSAFFWSDKAKNLPDIDAEIQAFHRYVFRSFARGSSFSLYSIQGVPIIDAIVRHEELVDDLQKIYDRLGLGQTNVGNVRAKGSSRPERARGAGAARYVTPDVREYLDLVFAREIRLLSGQWSPVPGKIRNQLYRGAGKRVRRA
jgi:hypothetical protein